MIKVEEKIFNVITEDKNTNTVVTEKELKILEVNKAIPGAKGKSIYQVWLDEGNEGTKQDMLDSFKGDNGIGVPNGGTTGQVLSKKSNINFDTEWKDVEAGGMVVVETYNDLPTTATQGDLILIRRDTVVPKIVDMDLGVLYPKAYFNPNINVGNLGFTQDFFAGISYGENGEINADFEIYPAGDGEGGFIQAPYIDIVNTSILEYIDDSHLTAVQTLWLYISETVEFWIAGQMVIMKLGWNRLSVKIKFIEGVIQYYDVLIDYNSPPTLMNVTLGQLNDDWGGIQNQIFDDKPYTVHNSGIYEWCDEDNTWCMIMQSSDFKPEDIEDEETTAEEELP